jgi:cell division transport system permease protein
MKSLREHINTILPITILLIGLQAYIFMSQMLDGYKNKLLEDYSIVVVSKDELSLKSFTQTYIKDVKKIEINSSIESLQNSISNKNFKLLKSKIPNFYNVTLKKLPDQDSLAKIKVELEEYKFVKKAEVFSKTHEKLYNFFVLNNRLITLFFYTSSILSILLLAKQIEIWRAKYSQRLHVMSLFGAGEFIKNADLFKNFIIDAVISSILTTFFFLYIENNEIARLSLEDLGIDNISFDIVDFRNLFIVSIGVALCVLFFVTLKNRK